MNMIRKLIYTASSLLLIFSTISCSDDASFDNKVFNTTSKTETVLIKSNVVGLEKSIKVSMAQQEKFEVHIRYKADPSLVKTYNEGYYDNAIMLPAVHYNIPNPTVKIPVGGVSAPDLIVELKDINKLNKDSVYVLPITIDEANVGVLSSASTTYYVFKAGALINVVANISKNYVGIDSWKAPEAVNSLPQMTMEALVRADKFDKEISTVMGIEDYFLIRIGDAGFPSNQIQIAIPHNNFPSANAVAGLPTKQWVHIALTYDKSNNGRVTLYVDGKYQAHKEVDLGNLNFAKTGNRGFYIGYSYDAVRYLDGDISECRIWNVVRTQEEIAKNPYDVDPSSPGLVAYWKFDEGAGDIIHDRTAFGNDMKTKVMPKWIDVTIPTPKK